MVKISSGNFSSLANGFKCFWQASWNVSSLANFQKYGHEKMGHINEHKHQKKKISNTAATSLIQGTREYKFVTAVRPQLLKLGGCGFFRLNLVQQCLDLWRAGGWSAGGSTSRGRAGSALVQVTPRGGAPEGGLCHFVEERHPCPRCRELLDARPVREGGGKVGQSSEMSQVGHGELLLSGGVSREAKLGPGVDARHAGGVVGLFVGFLILPPAVEEEHNEGADDDDRRHPGSK